MWVPLASPHHRSQAGPGTCVQPPDRGSAAPRVQGPEADDQCTPRRTAFVRVSGAGSTDRHEDGQRRRQRAAREPRDIRVTPDQPWPTRRHGGIAQSIAAGRGWRSLTDLTTERADERLPPRPPVPPSPTAPSSRRPRLAVGRLRRRGVEPAAVTGPDHASAGPRARRRRAGGGGDRPERDTGESGGDRVTVDQVVVRADGRVALRPPRAARRTGDRRRPDRRPGVDAVLADVAGAARRRPPCGSGGRAAAGRARPGGGGPAGRRRPRRRRACCRRRPRRSTAAPSGPSSPRWSARSAPVRRRPAARNRPAAPPARSAGRGRTARHQRRAPDRGTADRRVAALGAGPRRGRRCSRSSSCATTSPPTSACSWTPGAAGRPPSRRAGARRPADRAARPRRGRQRDRGRPAPPRAVRAGRALHRAPAGAARPGAPVRRS